MMHALRYLPIIVGVLFLHGIDKPCVSMKQYGPWDSVTNWRLYKIQSRKAYSYSVDTLRNFRSVKLNNDSMKSFLANVRPFEMDNLAWMGYYVASCEGPNGKLKKVIISMYGGFFWDPLQGKYYELPLVERKDWLAYLSASYETMETE